jgi:hypothetical protein
MLNIFYVEPEGDRWFPYDRYPRRIIRRVVRGKSQPGGQKRMFLNLCTGLKKIRIGYRVNDYSYTLKHSDETACILGKPFVLDQVQWKNPIVFGPAVYSHPSDDPNLLRRLPIRKILVPGEWMRRMCTPAWGDIVAEWPVGIDAELWKPSSFEDKTIDFLIYDKVMWEHDHYQDELIKPIHEILKQRNCSFTGLRYGYYREEQFHHLLARCKAMIFLCEHETQGIAYQQALSCGVPILAWDRGGYWQDPMYYPERVKFSPVSSVPYWDERCGLKFTSIVEFSSKLDEFLIQLKSGEFHPRDYILENLALEKCAHRYVELVMAATRGSETSKQGI